ncbi:hypothetical protein BYT27DRAFT_7340349 [Phlegmacium glaucopus]|nr:hypothetical protein BYT27DRAFT_7340349 [Phlegmacium glaucopus]
MFPWKDSIRKYAFQFAPEIALNTTILAALITIRPAVGQLARRFVGIEPQLINTPLPPAFNSHCPKSTDDYFRSLGLEPGGCSTLSLKDMSMYAAIVGLFAYVFFFLGISISQDEREQLKAILGTIIKGTFSLATEAIRKCIGRLHRIATYPLKTVLGWIVLHWTLRARLEITRPLFSKLKLVTSCLFYFCLGFVVAMAYYHSQSLSAYAHLASCDLSLVASDLTHRAQAHFATITITKLNSVLTTLLFSLGLRLWVRSLLSSIAFIFYKKARKLRPKASLLINNDAKQDNAIREAKKSLAESDEDTLCDDEAIDSKVDNTFKDESEEAVSVANGAKEDDYKQWHEQAVISTLSSATEDPKHTSGVAHSPTLCASPVHSKSLQQQQVEKLGSQPTWSYKSSLSASSPEFVPQSRNTVVSVSTLDYCSPHWALAPPVSVRITAPVKRPRSRRGARLQNTEMVVSNGPGSSSRGSQTFCA